MKRLLALLALSAQPVLAQGIEIRGPVPDIQTMIMDVGSGTLFTAHLVDRQGRIIQPISTGTILWRSTSPVLRVTRVRVGAIDVTADRIGIGRIVASWWNQGRTWFDTMTVQVRTANQSPVARIREFCTLGVCDLTANLSSDPDDDLLKFEWRAAGERSAIESMEVRRSWSSTLPNLFNQWLVVSDGRGGVDSTSHGVSIPAPVSVSLTSSRDTVLQRPAPGQSDGTHLAIVQPTVLTNEGAGSAADVRFSTSDTTAATYTRNPTDGSLVVSDPTKNATVTISAQYTRDGYTAAATKSLVLVMRAPVPTGIAVAVLDSSLRVHDSTRAVVAVTDQWGSILSVPVLWESSDSTILHITKEGTVTARAEGSAELRAIASPTLVGRVVLSVGPAPVSSITVGFDYTTEVIWPFGIGAFSPTGETILCGRITRTDGTMLLGDKVVEAFRLKDAAGLDSVGITAINESPRTWCKDNTSQLFPIAWTVEKFKPWEVPIWLPVVRAIIPPR